MPKLTVCYILLHFPRLTETAIAEEINALRLRGVDVRIVSLLPQGSGPVQPLSESLLRYTWYAPQLFTVAIWQAQWYFLVRSARLYFSLLVTFLTQPYPHEPFPLLLKRIIIFLKAVAIAKHLKNDAVDMLHSHFAWLPGGATWLCARLLDLPFTVTVHAYDIYSKKNDLLRLVSREAVRIVAISEYNRAQVVAAGGCSANKVSVIHCGIDLSKFRESAGETTEQDRNGSLRIISVGSLVAKKGFDVLVDACSILEKKGIDFLCTIIGSGPLELGLRQKIRDCGLQRRVRLLGAQASPDVIESHYQHDVAVLACVIAPDGDRDGIPAVLMEAGKVGLPLVSTAVTGIPELVRHGETGFLATPGDAAGLAEAIEVLAFDPPLRKRLGSNARSLVESEFDILKSTAKLESLFRSTSLLWRDRDTRHACEDQIVSV